jgi:ABC-2 type transport system permease protein
MTHLSPRRAWAMARKETLHVLRDPWSLGLAVVIPMILLVLFGYALTLDVDRVPLVIWDQSGTATSRELISHFTGSRYFAVYAYITNYHELDRAIDSRSALAGLVIPRDFAQRLGAGSNAPVQLVLDGSDSMTATLALGYATAVTQGYSQQVAMDHFQRIGGRPPAPPLDLRPRVWFNADMESRNSIVPGLIVISMMIIAAMLTSLTIAREWERGTMEQLVSTPVKGPEVIAGKLLPYFAIGMFDMLMVVLMGYFMFHVPLRGSVVLLLAVSAVFLTGVLAMGMLISIVTRSQLLSSQLAMIVTFLPAFLLSGFIYPIDNMPAPIQAVTYLIPARYFIELLRGIYLKGVGLQVLAFDATLLLVFAVLMLVLANVAFKKRLA